MVMDMAVLRKVYRRRETAADPGGSVSWLGKMAAMGLRWWRRAGPGEEGEDRWQQWTLRAEPVEHGHLRGESIFLQDLDGRRVPAHSAFNSSVSGERQVWNSFQDSRPPRTARSDAR